MWELLVMGLAGFAAAFVDGVLGMGFGPTSASILLSSGINPTGVSTSINIVKVATGVAGGLSHWQFGNIDRRLVARLAVPGVLGALGGTFVLTHVDPDAMRPVLAVFLLLIGMRILLRFRSPIVSNATHAVDHPKTTGVEVAGAVGGFTNGLIGAWGPVVTPFLLHRGVMPRIVVGSVNVAEIAVAFVAAGSLLSAGGTGIRFATIAAMLVGGIIAAPIAAWSVRVVPARALGLAVAFLLLVTNVRELANWQGLGASRFWAYAAVTLLVAWAAGARRLTARRSAALSAGMASAS
jgi:uncharacterized membrane protein YfcA